ncbi:MAG TPA: trypsin-like peptidase domain-containing protein [Chthoniobacteraceae bacterium]|nr:trypsin-like peptidase domain-containing protein [Chthoniobacteraceae bacterium]
MKSISRTPARRLAVGVGCAVLGSAIACAEDARPPVSVAEAISQEVRHVFERCRSAVVKVEAIDTHGPLSGTGFYIDPNGTLLTSYTVGGETTEIIVSGELQKMPARRLVADPRCGVAILKVDTETPFLTLGKIRDLSVAAPVVTIGYPMDLPVTPSFGTVAGFDIKFAGRYFATAHIRANVPVQRGQGGAPLLNFRGEVVGIMISSLDGGSASFAVPIDAAEKVRKDFVRFGELRPGWLGIAVRTSIPPTAGSTAQIDELMAGSPGARAGLEKDDIILEIGDRKIRSTEDVLDAAFFTTAEDELPIKVSRGGKEIVVNTIPTDHPNNTHAPLPTVPRLQAIPTGSPRGLSTPAPLIDR